MVTWMREESSSTLISSFGADVNSLNTHCTYLQQETMEYSLPKSLSLWDFDEISMMKFQK